MPLARTQPPAALKKVARLDRNTLYGNRKRITGFLLQYRKNTAFRFSAVVTLQPRNRVDLKLVPSGGVGENCANKYYWQQGF